MIRLDYALLLCGDLKTATIIISVFFLIIGTWGTNTYIGINIKMLVEIDRTYGSITEPPEINTTNKSKPLLMITPLISGQHTEKPEIHTTTRRKPRQMTTTFTTTTRPPRLKRSSSEKFSALPEMPGHKIDEFQFNFSKPDQPLGHNINIVYIPTTTDSTNRISIKNDSFVVFVTKPMFANDQKTSTMPVHMNLSDSNSNYSLNGTVQSSSINIGIDRISKNNNFKASKVDAELEGNVNDTRGNETSARWASHEDLTLAAQGSLVIGIICALLFTSSIYLLTSIIVSKHELLIAPSIMIAIAGCVCMYLVFIDLNVIDVRHMFFGISYVVAFFGGIIKIIFGFLLLYIALIVYSYYQQEVEKASSPQEPPTITQAPTT